MKISTRLALSGLLLPSLAWAAPASEVWVYTSIYKENAVPLAKTFEKQNPNIKVNVFQAGSEKIQAKLEAELVAKKPQADVIIISDPFYLANLEKRDLLLKSPGKNAIETNYYSAMVLISHKSVPESARPKSFQDLSKPEFKDQIQIGSPLESGSTFSVVAYLQHKYGWPFFDKLRANHLSSNGGNSTVIQKVESGEKKFGIVLVENALAAKKRKSPIEIIYPSDGSFAIPSVQGVLKDAKHKEEAVKFATFMLTEDAQKILRSGYMHSTHPKVGAPEGGKSLSEMGAKTDVWNAKFISDVASQSKDIKKKFASLFLE